MINAFCIYDEQVVETQGDQGGGVVTCAMCGEDATLIIHPGTIRAIGYLSEKIRAKDKIVLELIERVTGLERQVRELREGQ